MDRPSLPSVSHASTALSSGEVFPPDPPDLPVVAVLSGALAVGRSSYDAVIAEHVPLMPRGESCRSCGFVYTERRICPALILAMAGHPVLADRIRLIPEADPDHRAMCELTVAVERMSAQLNVLGARTTPTSAPKTRRWWVRLPGPRRNRP